jgi:V-type H+-transporting ATPase subunit H
MCSLHGNRVIIDDDMMIFVQRENVMRLNENNHDILRTLVGVLEESQNPVAIAVAAHDLGEYVRYYPRGKK